MSVLKGAEILIESLLKENVDVVFGYPGGAVLDIYDALYKSTLKHYLTRHEQGAVHAADGYARSTGRVGVCMATSGPGSTNLVTGLATAYRDSVPLVAFTGQVATALIGTDAFQEADIRGISIPITKHNYLVTDVNKLATNIKEAFYIARTGRPGPVLIDIPDDVARAEIEFEYPAIVDLPGYNATYRGHSVQITRAAAAINKANRPLIVFGGGTIISGAVEEARQLVDKTGIPVMTTLMGLGTYPNKNDRLSLGMPGVFGTKCVNLATAAADLLVAVGMRFDNRVTCALDSYAADAEIVHIDIDPAEIGKNIAVDIPIVGDVKLVLQKLNPLLKKKNRKAWLKQIQAWKEEYSLQYDLDNEGIKPQYVLEELSKLTKGEVIIATEVGQHQIWAAQYYNHINPRYFMTSGGLGTMGFGFPAAIGAQIGNPDKCVVLIAGDGSLQMNIQEMATLSNYKLPVKIIILNNGCLGMVRQYQEFFFGGRYSEVELKNPDFVKIADAYGIYGLNIEHKEEVIPALAEMMAREAAVLLDIHIAPGENVCPMVPPGAGITNMIGG